MSMSNIHDALREFAQAADDLAAMCDVEAPEYGRVWHTLVKNARALSETLAREDLHDLIRGAQLMFGYHPGSFSEVYVQREDPDELVAENAKFDSLKARVSAALGKLIAASTGSRA